MHNNPGRGITIYQVAELSAKAFAKSFTISNVLAGFRATGICPINSNFFEDSDFEVASVTERVLVQSSSLVSQPLDFSADSSNLQSEILTNPESHSTEANFSEHLPSTMPLTATEDAENLCILQELQPFPKRASNNSSVNVTKRRKLSSAILTDSVQTQSAITGSIQTKVGEKNSRVKKVSKKK